MTVTYEAIATYSVSGSSVSSYTFTGIPSTYTDLILVASVLRTSTSDTRVQVGNGSIDTGNNYSYTFLGGNGSSPSSFKVANAGNWDLGYATTASFTTLTTQFQNYSNTTTHKTALSRFSSTTGDVAAFASLWRSTSAINQIKIYQFSGNLDIGSTFTLYGIKAA
jgi:hypothetical protein